jgi:hypothetical protein
MELARRLAKQPIDHLPALNGGALSYLIGPPVEVAIILHREEFSRFV